MCSFGNRVYIMYIHEVEAFYSVVDNLVHLFSIASVNYNIYIYMYK